MEKREINILSIKTGSIIAPAGYGKTELIAKSLSYYEGSRPVLILTHTNAGVVALRERLCKEQVSTNFYRLYTIDGWVLKVISSFPQRSQFDTQKNSNIDKDFYPQIRRKSLNLVMSGKINEILISSYSQIIVDEYQDCSNIQHQIITQLAQCIPTCVLGDPLQAIFDFNDDRQVDWDNEVVSVFPTMVELVTPWRWINSKSERLGEWLHEVRQKLIRCEPIDLRKAPPEVRWVKLDGKDTDYQLQLDAARVKSNDPLSKVLVIGDSIYPSRQHAVASQTPGAIAVEAVELKCLVSFASTFVINSHSALNELISFAGQVLTNTSNLDLISRIEVIRKGANRKPPTTIEQIAINFQKHPTYQLAYELLISISKEPGIRNHRPAVFSACLRTLQYCIISPQTPFLEAAIRIREQYRYMGRKLPKRAVGSTLLLKGLEADHVVILNADALNMKNLYVALTRGSKGIVICSKSPVISFAKQSAS